MLNAVLLGLAALFVVATLLPLLRHDAWWIRVFDFPRLQVVLGGAALLLAYWLGVERAGPAQWVLFGALGAALLYQLARIAPYTPLWRREVKSAERPGAERSVALLVANVLMDNRNAAGLLEIVRRTDPDLVLTVETDRWWDEQLRPLAAHYPYAVREPLPNTYGMLLYSRLELIEPEVRYLVEDGIPSVHAGVRLRSGERVALHCLHPKPPAPQESGQTTERDAELLLVGRAVAERERPTIVAGDLNDVAWSYTTRLFQKTSGLLDPRRGRGMFNSFSARTPLLRWPLDHVFHSSDFHLVKLARCDDFGSDHFPVYVALQLDGRAPLEQPEPHADAEDVQAADEKIEKVTPKEPVP